MGYKKINQTIINTIITIFFKNIKFCINIKKHNQNYNKSPLFANYIVFSNNTFFDQIQLN